MVERRGWLLDVYADEQDGAVIWLLGEDDGRYRLTHLFPVTFYAAGPFPRLRAVWRYLQTHPLAPALARRQRRDLFAGPLDVLAVTVPNPAQQRPLFHEIHGRFPDLDYYDADLPLPLRYAAMFQLFPLAHCQVYTDAQDRVTQITPLNSPWDLEPQRPPLRILQMAPDSDPAHRPPDGLHIRYGRDHAYLPLQPRRHLLLRLQATLNRYDPDLILTRGGDTWLFPTLLAHCRQEGVRYFNPNRDRRRQPQQRRAHSYFTYGQVVHRGLQVHLYGRWHIDSGNAMMFAEYGLDGVFEQAVVTGLPVQEIARKSPGAGITAMQMVTAWRAGILIPHQKQQAEAFKTARQLLRADRGGLVYQPLIGLHQDVAELDFVSMYPSIMVRHNISPETVGRPGAAAPIPGLDTAVDQSETGLVPHTLRPLLAKRIALKQQLAGLNRRDCRYRPLKARAAALKWLLVVCFGYLGYKNARFGRIESHEAVTAYGREALLQAKEAAEDLGFTVLHLYVDGLWVKQAGHSRPQDFHALQAEIQTRTGLPIALEGVYRWIAFLPSRRDERVPVANRYFGAFQDGSLKLRGIAARRRDTPAWIAAIQIEILRRFTAVATTDITPCLPPLWDDLRRQVAALRAGQVPLEQLLVTQALKREPAAYRVPSPAARAAAQLAAAGKKRRPGQHIRFLFTRGDPGVFAWDLPQRPLPEQVDTARYLRLLIRAVSTLLYPWGFDEAEIERQLQGGAQQLCLPAATRPLTNKQPLADGRQQEAASGKKHPERM